MSLYAYAVREEQLRKAGLTESQIKEQLAKETTRPPTPAPPPAPPPQKPRWRVIPGGPTSSTTEAPPIEKATKKPSSPKLDVELRPIGPDIGLYPATDVPPAFLEKIHLGPPPESYDVVRAQEEFREALHQRVMQEYMRTYEKEPHSSPEELVDIGKSLQLQYEHWKEKDQLEPPVTIPEDVWKELTTKDLAEKVETPEGAIVYTTKPGVTYAQIQEAFEAVGLEAPQTVKTFADFNARVRRYLKDVERRKTYISFKEQIKPDPMIYAMRAAIFPVTVGVGIGVGLLKGGTFGLVGKEVPGGYEMMFGAAEKLGRKGGEPQWFTTRERAEQFAATPELSFGVVIGETLAFWGWGRIFGKIGGLAAARAGPKVKEILTIGEVTAPRATRIFRAFGKVITAPARGISAAGHRIYTGAVKTFERATGKTVWTQRRAGELVAAETLGGRIDVGPAALRAEKIQWAALWKPGKKIAEVPYLEVSKETGKLPHLYLRIQAERGIGYAEQAMMTRITGKKLIFEAGVYKGIEAIAPSADVTATLVKGFKSAAQQYGYKITTPLLKTGGPWAGGLPQQASRTISDVFSPTALSRIAVAPTFPIETPIGGTITGVGTAIAGAEAATISRIFAGQRLVEVPPKKIGEVGFRGATEALLKSTTGIGIEIVPTISIEKMPAQVIRTTQQAMTKTVTEAITEVVPSPFAKTAAPSSQLFLPPFWFGGGAAGGGPRRQERVVWLHLRRAREMGDPMRAFFGIRGWPRAWTEAVQQVRVPFGRGGAPIMRAKRTRRRSRRRRKIKVFG